MYSPLEDLNNAIKELIRLYDNPDKRDDLAMVNLIDQLASIHGKIVYEAYKNEE